MSGSSSGNEIFKLRKELMFAKEKIDDLTKLKVALESEFNACRKQRDSFQIEADKAKIMRQNQMEWIEGERKKVREEERTIYERNLKDLETLKDLNERHTRQITMQEEEIRNKDMQIQNLRKELKNLKHKQEGEFFNETKWDQDQKELSEESGALRRKIETERKKFTQLSEKMDNILAENRVLRRLAEVPENYGFNLEEIKIAERHQIEEYKAKVRYLEKDLEELEGERLQLRNRLRILSNLFDQNPKGERYKNLTSEELVRVNEFVYSIRNKIPQVLPSDGTKTLEREQYIKELEERLRNVERDSSNLENRSNFGQQQFMGSQAQYSTEDIRNILQQNEQFKSMLKYMTELLEEMKKNERANGGVQSNISNNPGANNQNQYLQGEQGNLARPPQPMPGSFGNWDDISQVRSFKFKQNIPADIFELYSGVGFDTVLAKYQIAQLQVMNLETMKILKVKETEYKNMEGELEEMREQLKKCLLIQDNLYEKYFEDTMKLREREKGLKDQLEEKTSEVQKLLEELKNYRDMNSDNMRNDSNKMLQKVAELSHKMSILDVNLIKISRKYTCLKDEYAEISDSYKNVSIDFSKKEQELIEKIHSLLDWKKKASHYLKVLLEESQNSISKSKHNILRNKLEKSQDDLANIKEKNTALLSEIQKLKSSERELDEKTTKIRIMEDEMTEIQLEIEMTKKMLEISDPHFKRYQNALQKLVNIMTQKTISPMQVFTQIDDNRDGKLNPLEFQQAMKKLKVDFNQQETEILFRFMDFDGNNKIDLKEFSRKMRRQGLTIRKSQEQVVFNLWEKMQQAGLSISDTFQAFDKDRSGEVTKEEMLVTLKQLIKGIDDETIDYIFKIADTSGDGKITYGEFHALFENIIQDVMRQQMLMNVEELSWSKQVVLKIDEAIHQQGQYIKDLYNYIDNNGDEKISFQEFKSLFDNLKLEIEDEHLKQLFHDIDIDSNNYIEYNELMNYIRQAKVEKTKIEKMKRVSEKIREMQKQSSSNQQMDDQDIQSLPREARLEMKISLMEIKEKNLLNRTDTLMYSLNLTKKENARIQLQLNEREQEILSHLKKFNEAQRMNYKLLNMIQGSETKSRAKQIHNLNKRVLKENVELRSQNRILKDLHEFASNQVKSLLISLERKKFESEHLNESIKDLQAMSDERAIVGKLQHSLMVSRYNQAQVNINYDTLVHDLQRQKQEIQVIESEVAESKDDAMETREVLKQKIMDYEDQITELRTRILPTINMSKIDEMYSRINELASMKMNLEMQNKKLRDENHELAIKCDYFEALEQQFDQLKQDLKSKYSDDLQHRVIELSMQVSEQRLLEMKSKRDQELAKEKEEYFSRITRQHMEHVKQLEQEVESVNRKFNERETFWRQKHQEAMDMVMNDKAAKEKEDDALLKFRRDAGKTNKLIGQVKFSKESSKRGSLKDATSAKMIGGGEEIADSEQFEELKRQFKEAKDNEARLKDEVNRLNDTNKLLKEQARQEDSGQSRTSHSQIFNEEGEKLAQAAQRTISTLQGIIDDKNFELERKELIIEKMKRDFRAEKEKDSLQIRQLISQVNLAPQQNLNPMSNISNLQNSSKFRNNEYWDDVGDALGEKDKYIEQLANEKDDIDMKKKLLEKKVIQQEEVIKNLEDELVVERQKNQTTELEAQVSRLQKLLKERNKTMQDIKSQMEKLGNDYKIATEQSLDKEDQYKKKVLQVKKDNKQLEENVQKLLETVKDQRKQIDAAKQSISVLQGQEDKNRRSNASALRVSNEDDKVEKLLKGGDKSIKQDQPVKQESQNIAVLDMKKQLNKEKQDHEKTQAQLRDSQLKSKELEAKITGLVVKQYEDLVDEEGYLKPIKKMNFENPQEIAAQMKKFFGRQLNFSFISELRLNEERKTGVVLLPSFKKIIDLRNLRLRQEDMNIIVNQVSLPDQQKVAPEKQRLSIDKLYYLVNNISDMEIQTIDMDLDVKGSGGKQQPDRSDGFKSSLGKDKFSATLPMQQQQQQLQSSLLRSRDDDLQKRNDMLKAQFNNLKEEKDKLQKQLTLKGEQCKSLELQIKKAVNKTGLDSGSANASHRGSIQQKNEQQMEAVSELKDMIFELEDEKNKQLQILRQKDLEIKKSKEEKTKAEELLKDMKIQNMKLSSQVESKLSPQELKQNILMEKDILIKDLKDKLDNQRREEQNTIDQLYSLEKENKELKFVKEQFDVQIQRLNRRIQELEEIKQQNSLKKPESAYSTIKKQKLI